MSTEQKSALGANVISLPIGGGAIAGMGESFSPDLFTGTGNFSVPIAVPPGRNGLQPSLTLGYSTGSGNGAFGLGWNLSLPGVSRKTNLGIPRYDDTKDVFVLSGAEDLIPVERGQKTVGSVRDNWIRYQPRTEGLFARIIHHKWTDGQDYWEVRTKDGMVTWYGKPGAQPEDNTVLYDPENPGHIASWMISRTADPFGSEVVYEYERDLELSPYPFTQLYLKRIKYADYTHNSIVRHLCSVELEYADRADAHSEYRQGFEVRTRRRCKAIHTRTHPLDMNMPQGYTASGTNDNTIQVKTYHLTYRDELGHVARNKVSQLARVQVEGFDLSTAHEVTSESLPPVEFEYTDFDIARRDLRVLNDAHLPAMGLGHPDMDLVDLDGNGLPDFVQMSAGQPIRYWRNKGNGVFDLPRTMRNAPTGLALGSGAVQLMDADGDGRVDLVMNAPNFAGYYSLNHDGEWDTGSFRKYSTRPPINLQSAQAQFMDLSGDGRTDVLINGNRFECYFQNSPLLQAPLSPGEGPGVRAQGLVDENRAVGWSEARFVNKGTDLADFPNVNFGDPRIRTADLSGDGLQDIVEVQNGNISYWPNLGYGRFGKRRTMRGSPRLGYAFNPAQLILGDADGDGLTDVIYVEHDQITIWINQSGNGFSEPIVIKGTPSPLSPLQGRGGSVRMVDLFGTGTPGILWSYDLGAASTPLSLGEGLGVRAIYLDLTGGTKPYVMVGMRNNLGARTRVQYGSSVAHYLRDTYGTELPSAGSAPLSLGEGLGVRAGKWKTTLPFPVQVVDRVEVIDEISKGKLTTRYFYHHGYWDGGEREFRGFGRVDQFDTETFDRYNTDDLILDLDLNAPLSPGEGPGVRVSVEHYAPPVLAKNWFHLGPVGAEKGDWKEVDFANEYFPEFAPLSPGEGPGVRANMLQRDPAMLQMIAGLPRRARRDAFRTLRGTALRSELYAMDGSPLQQRPYTVSETQTGLRLVDSPLTNATIAALKVETHSNHIFFSYGLSSRSTTWERGNDPLTKFSFTGEVDAYGQPLSQISIAVPRGKDPRTGLELSGHSGVYDPARGYDATIQYTEHIYRDVPAPDPASSVGISYAVDRVKQARSYEAVNNGSMPVFALRDDMLRPTAQWTLATPKLLALSYTYYDGGPFYGMPYGQMERYGLPVRTETLMVQPTELAAAYGPPPAPFNGNWNGHPTDFVNELPDSRCGYRMRSGGPEQFVPGHYTTAQALAYDFQGWSMAETVVGLPMAMRDAYDSMAYVTYDPYQLFPTSVVDPLGMATYAGYDYRVMQVVGAMDVNMNVTLFSFTPLGLMNKTAVLGKYDAPEGDTLDTPGVLLEYDLFAFMLRGEPVWVKTTQREHHVNAPYGTTMPPHEFNATLVAVEYSDGFGRQLQTRTQAESVLFGVTVHPGSVDGLGSSGLPADQGAPNAPAVGRQGPPPPHAFVTVSGAKLYNNKGKVVEQWEPYFSQGFAHAVMPSGAETGQRVRIYYDALGRPKRTVNPDGTMQAVVYGIPATLATPPIGVGGLPSLGGAGGGTPTPWERYTYDANDLAGLTHPEDTTVPPEHRWTPKSEVVDALGRTIMTVEHCAPLSSGPGPGVRPEDVVMGYAYDIKGQLLKVTDPLGRVCFEHKYDTAGNTLWTKHLDSGIRTLVVDAQGKPLYSNDAKGARTYTSYDRLNRPTGVWARDKAVELFTKRQTLIYGDQSDIWPREDRNLWGRLYQHYDEAGKVQVEGYDFKGNPLEKTRWVIKDSAIWSGLKWAVDWTPMDESILDTRAYTTTLAYDALNRVRNLTYPEDANNQRQELAPRYNRAGALERMDLQGAPVLEHVAYNAKGQRILVARPNGFHTRYAYDPVTFRLQRIRTERFSHSGNTYTPLSGNVRQDTGYEYDLGGNITKIKERVTDCGINGSLLGSDALDKTFEYDPLKRLLKATGRESGTKWNGDHWTPVSASTASPNANNVRAYTRRYSYDKVGNVQELVHQAISNNYTRHYNYLIGKNHLASIDSGGSPPSVNASFQYDVNGNLVKNDTARFYEWNAADQLAYTKLQPIGGPMEIQANYLYDAAGQRVKKLVRNGGGYTYEATVYIDGIFLHRYNTNQQQTSLLVMDGRSRIATVRAGDPMDGNIPYFTYELEDHLGSQVARMDDTGGLVDRDEYYPFGEYSLRQYTVARYGYVGKEYDFETGLNYYGARYYAAWTCRFISVDPLAGQYAHLNPYNYAGNKPIGDLDIDGMQGTGETPAHSGASSMGNAEFNEKAQAALKSNPTTTELEFSTDGVNSYGSITTDGNTVCYDSNVGFTDPAGNVLQKANTKGGLIIPQRDAEGLLVLSKNPPSSNASNAGSGASATEAIGGIQGPETKEQADRRESLTMLAEAVDYAYFGRSSKPASDDTVESDQLFYQWVHGTGPDTRTFRQGSNMANWMLGADYVQAAMRSAAGKAMKGNLGTTQFMHSARETNEYWYPFEFAGDALTNPARAFHGSIAGSVTTYGIVDSNGKKGVIMRIQMSDNMTAISGTRARPSEGGYAPNQPNAVYPQENPYGPNGQFRTIHIRYDINIHYFPN